MTWGLLRRLVPTAVVVGMTAAAKCRTGADSDCPLQIRRIYLTGRAPQVIVRNKASYPVGHVVIHAAYQDLFNKYQEPTKEFDTIIQPNQRLTLSLDPIKGSIEWESLNVFATCEPADSVQHADSTSGR
jgi:hypothetical protein